MAMSFSRPDPASPAAVADASFKTSRRGFDQGEVHEFLRMVAAELGRLQERERFLERELRNAQSNPDLNAVDLDDAALTRLLGEETARVLTTARESANEIRDKAERSGAQLLMEASDEAARVREEADIEAARRRADATADAESEIEMAKQQGREMVNEARAYRERVLSELARRRELAREQIEQLVHGRDRLTQAFERARLVASDVVAELEPLGEPNEYVNLSPTTGPVPVMVANEPPQGASAEAASEPSDPDTPEADEPDQVAADGAEADTVDAEVDDDPVTADPSAADEVDDALVDSENLVIATGVETPDAESHDIEDHHDEDRDSENQEVEDPEVEDPDVEAAIAPVIELVADAGRPADDEARAPVETVDDEDEPLASTDDATPVDADDDATPVDADADVASDPAPGDLSVDDTSVGVAHDPAEPSDEVVVDLFARLRAETSDDPAGVDAAGSHDDASDDAETPDDAETSGDAETPDVGASSDGADDAEPDTVAGSATLVGDLVESPVEQVDAAVVTADDDESPFRHRDAELTPIIVACGKKLKRVLADEQNEVLEALRRGEPVTDIDNVLPSADDHLTRFRDAISDQLLAAANLGASAVTGGTVGKLRKKPGGVACDAAAEVIDEWIVVPLRERLDRCVAEGDGDNAVVSRRTRSVYREWKTQHIDERLDDVARMAYGRGAYEAVEAGTPLVWSVDGDHPACPDCDDNGLAGPVAAGDEFPTGHLFSPAHPGCRCLLLRPGR